MVYTSSRTTSSSVTLSVLALSSRFDGPAFRLEIGIAYLSFSTRSVESF